MRSVRIKLCGITNLDDALACASAGAEYLGFVFYPPSPRHIAPRDARSIIAALPPAVTPVGVFVNCDAGAVAIAAAESGIRAVQLSGDEPPETCRRIGLPVIKVFRPARQGMPASDPATYDVFAAMADGGGDGQYGGTGTPADLPFALKLGATHRLFLAGGLNPGNVAAAISGVRPYAVDATSGIEERPGRKDHALVAEFCAAVRSTCM